MSIKEIYLKAHAAVLDLETKLAQAGGAASLNPVQLAEAKLEAFAAAELDVHDLGSFEAHFDAIRANLKHLATLPAASELLSAAEKRIAASKAKLAAKQAENEEGRKPAAVTPAPKIVAQAPAPAPVPKVEPAPAQNPTQVAPQAA